MYHTSRIIKCPECGNAVKEVCTFDERGRIIENHAFCADSGGTCLWGGAWPNNQRNIANNKKRTLKEAQNEKH